MTQSQTTTAAIAKPKSTQATREGRFVRTTKVDLRTARTLYELVDASGQVTRATYTKIKCCAVANESSSILNQSARLLRGCFGCFPR